MTRVKPSLPPPRLVRSIRRLGFAALGLLNLAWGGWAVAAPAHFLATFPGFGLHWTAAYPPFNQHLVVDLGATMLTLAVLSQLRASANWHSIAREWMYGDAPVTELGVQEAEFYGRSGVGAR